MLLSGVYPTLDFIVPLVPQKIMYIISYFNLINRYIVKRRIFVIENSAHSIDVPNLDFLYISFSQRFICTYLNIGVIHKLMNSNLTFSTFYLFPISLPLLALYANSWKKDI